MSDKVKLSHAELVAEIRNRTRVSAKDINAVLGAFFDVAKETLLYGVELNIENFGKFSFVDYVPMKDVEIYNPKTKQREKAAETIGYRKPTFKFSRKYKSLVKELTTKTYDEVFGTENKKGTDKDVEKKTG